MDITLYKAPDCLRCKITKDYLEAVHIPYEAFDLAADKDIVNTFYRTNRASLYRNPEGVEFPMFHDQKNGVIRQGTGVVLAYLLAGDGLDGCVSRSELLHGWISGLDVSKCPDGLEDKFLELISLLARGGLQVCLQSDGRRADLLEKILAEGLVEKMILTIPGSASHYPDATGGPAPSPEELGKSIRLAKDHKNHVIRLLLAPIRAADGSFYRLSPDQAGEAAALVLQACGDLALPFAIQASSEIAPGLEPLGDNLLPYRSRVRSHLPKADILKEDAGH
jgi:hypothetical protein